MKRITHSFTQGSPEWLAHRSACYNASDAGTAMGVNPYRTRNELIAELAGQPAAEHDDHTLARFADGHRFEALARPLAVELLGDDLFPLVFSLDVGLRRPLGASLDGCTMDESIIWEHKSLSESLAASLDRGEIPEQYHAQMEQCLLISGARRCLFMASKWDANDGLVDVKHMFYDSNLDLRDRLIRAWMQVEEEALHYVPQEVIPAAVAAHQETLPALTIQVDGKIALRDNLAVFGDALRRYVEGLNRKPATDDDFATLEAAVKALRKAEQGLDAAEASALAQTAGIDEMRRTVEDLRGLARTNRLAIEKLVSAEKTNRRNALLAESLVAYNQHFDALNKRLGNQYLPRVPHNFPGVISGKKTISSMQNALDTELARCKIELNENADRIWGNMIVLREQGDYPFLFADAAQIINKAPDDFAALVKLRVAEHKAAEEKKRAELVERIRREEEAKAEAKARAAQERKEVEERLRARLAEQEAQKKADAAIEAERKRVAEEEKAATDAKIDPSAEQQKPEIASDPAEPSPQKVTLASSIPPGQMSVFLAFERIVEICEDKSIKDGDARATIHALARLQFRALGQELDRA